MIIPRTLRVPGLFFFFKVSRVVFLGLPFYFKVFLPGVSRVVFVFLWFGAFFFWLFCRGFAEYSTFFCWFSSCFLCIFFLDFIMFFPVVV